MGKVEKLIIRHGRAKQTFSEHRSVLEEAYKYSLPDKGYFNTLTSGQRTTYIYDSTAVLALGVYADKVQQQLVPPWRKWFKLIPGSEIDPETTDEVQPDLDKVTDILYDHINHSNFNTKINEAFQDVGISTGIITCEEGDGIESHLTFNAISIEDVAMESSQTGIIENIFKDFSMRIADIEEIIQGAKITENMSNLLAKDPLAEIKLVESIIKNKDGKYDHLVYWEEEKEIIFEVVDDTSPYIVFRESVSSKGLYGMGRVRKIIDDIKVLNKLSEIDLKAAGFSISPPLLAQDDGVTNPYNFRLEPGTINIVGSNSNQNPSIKPLDMGSNFQLSQYKIEQKQDFINKTLLNMSLGEVSRTPVRTLGENQLRNQDQEEVTNASFSRFQTELLERLIKRMVDVLAKAGKISPIIVDGKEITIKFTSPLAKQQDKIDTNTLVEFAQILGATGIPLETVGAKIKFEDVPLFIAKNVGVPAELFRTPQEQQQYAMQQQQQAQAQAEAQQGQQ